MTKMIDTLYGVAQAVDSEGFDYAFRCYSFFEHVKDEKFQQLRKAYIDAANALKEYVGNIEDYEDEENDEEE